MTLPVGESGNAMKFSVRVSEGGSRRQRKQEKLRKFEQHRPQHPAEVQPEWKI
jgi:hypothetical protein